MEKKNVDIMHESGNKADNLFDKHGIRFVIKDNRQFKYIDHD